jgi:hypothetical protein
MTNKPFTFPVSGVAPNQTAETVAFSAALNRALGFATASQQFRPGKFPDQYTSVITGRGDSTGIAGAVVADTALGDVWEVTGAGVVALRDRVAVEEGAVVFARYRRSQDPADPSGDTVRFRVEWLDEAFASVGGEDIETGTLTVADGVIEASAVINAPTENVTPPAGAVYASAHVQTFGTDGKTQIINIGSRPVRSILAEYADRAGVAEMVEVEPTNEDETFYPTFVRPETAGDRELKVDEDLQYNPFTNTLTVPSIDAQAIDVDAITLPPDFKIDANNIPEFPIARTFYVAMNGNDAHSGTSASKPFRTIGRALLAMDLAQVVAGGPISVVTIVHPGDYLVARDSIIAPNCALYGYDLRVTMLRLANAAGNGPATLDADREQNMFLMKSGIKVRGFSFTGMQHEPYTFDPDNETGAPPAKGYAFVFNPGEVIIRSPYIADCTVIHDLTQDEMALPIDREAGNPLIRRGSGNIYADGSVLSGYSPLRSVVVDSFTAVNPNGIGYAIVRNALVQLVSVFTNWSRIGIWSHEGGQVTLANSNNTFGDYAFVATDSRESILIQDGPVLTEDLTSAADTIAAQTGSIISTLMGDAPDFNNGAFAVGPNAISSWAGFSPEAKANTEKDTRLLLKELVGDLRSGQERGAQRFVKGLFDWNAQYIWNTSAVSVAQFNQGFDAIRTTINGLSISPAAQSRVTALIGIIQTVLTDPAPYRVPFVSVIEYAGQAFSYAGSGVNYNALPFAQRGTAILPDPLSTIVQWGGARCYGTFSTERGDTYLGADLRVDFERGTVEGQAFARGVGGIALPLVIALG